VSDAIESKETVTPEAVAALVERAGLSIAPDRIEVIAQRLSELFDLAAPLDEASVEDDQSTQPFDPRWTEGGPA
jgi:hypothetical protein